MEIVVGFESASSIRNTSDLHYNGVIIELETIDDSFTIFLKGEKEEEVVVVLRLIWEIAFLYDGFFHRPTKYLVDGKHVNVNNLYSFSYYRTGIIWRNCAMPLVDSEIPFSARILQTYDENRNKSRADNSMMREIVNSFFYLHSEAYEHINVSHRLSLLFNICDGFIINKHGINKNITASISKLLKRNLDSGSIKHMADLLGLKGDELFKALSAERNETTHFTINEGSLSSYNEKIEERKRIYIKWYFAYVIELALRVAFLKHIGCECSNSLIEFALDNINDWAKIGAELAEECKIPQNKMEQELRKVGITLR